MIKYNKIKVPSRIINTIVIEVKVIMGHSSFSFQIQTEKALIQASNPLSLHMLKKQQKGLPPTKILIAGRITSTSQKGKLCSDDYDDDKREKMEVSKMVSGGIISSQFSSYFIFSRAAPVESRKIAFNGTDCFTPFLTVYSATHYYQHNHL